MTHHPDTLILPDVHHHIDEVDAVLRKFEGGFEQVVLLGDYVDNFGDSPQMMRRTCRWLCESIQQSNRIHLVGNHDLAYLAPDNPHSGCAGWSPTKQRIFDSECHDIPRDRLRLCAAVGPFLLSHAGFHPRFVSGRTLGDLQHFADEELRRVLAGEFSPLLACGLGRGGIEDVGGVTWLDWAAEFAPTPRLNQIVGHTPARGAIRGHHLSGSQVPVRTTIYASPLLPSRGPLAQPGEGWSSINWCIDCCGEFAVLLRDQVVEFIALGKH